MSFGWLLLSKEKDLIMAEDSPRIKFYTQHNMRCDSPSLGVLAGVSVV